MVHPAGTASKTVNSLRTLIDALVALIEREYNKDSNYRDATMPPLKKVYKGEPTVGLEYPSVAVALRRVEYEDAPQDAGADLDPIEIDIICYSSEIRREEQVNESIGMLEAVRHILLDNKTVPTAEGVETTFQIGYRKMSADFDMIFGNFEGELIGVEVAILRAPAVMGELGY